MDNTGDGNPEDTFNILIATDNHIGYAEKDPIRMNDSITTFEEILQLAQEHDVDFILLGGDLFHENKPSRWALHNTMALLRKYCMGDKAVQFEVLSDQKENFKHSKFRNVNYEDHNLNISIPVFSIHGNHDDPIGQDQLCALDILSVAGLVNYFGKCDNLSEVEISPLLFQKGQTKLALYGLGSIRDERLHRLFRDGKVKMLRPSEATEDWFNIMVLHQNRIKHGDTNYIPESFLDEFLNLVIWGHEHECRIKPELNTILNVFFSQPGSSVATSLCPGEAVEKHVGLLKIYKDVFKMMKIPLQTVRQFYFKDVVLSETDLDLQKPEGIQQRVTDFCADVIEELLKQAEADLAEHPKRPWPPLIRIRVEHEKPEEAFIVQRFGQKFINRVANPKDLVLFSRKRIKEETKELNFDHEAMLTGIELQLSALDNVREYFSKADSKNKLLVLSDAGLNFATQLFVEKDEKEAIRSSVDFQIEKTQTSLEQSANDDDLTGEMERLRDERKHKNEDVKELEKALSKSSLNQRVVDAESAGSEDEEDSRNDADAMVTTRGRSRGRGRGRGRGSTSRRSTKGDVTRTPMKGTRSVKEPFVKSPLGTRSSVSQISIQHAFGAHSSRELPAKRIADKGLPIQSQTSIQHAFEIQSSRVQQKLGLRSNVEEDAIDLYDSEEDYAPPTQPQKRSRMSTNSNNSSSDGNAYTNRRSKRILYVDD